MNEFLAQYYGTMGAPAATESTESTEKVAQAELFAKLAHENNIDLEKLSDAQVQQLWDATFGSEKTASDDNDADDKKEEKKDDKDEDEKKAAAEAEFAEKKAAAEKFAEADFLGRTMAHALVNELDKIASAQKTAADKSLKEHLVHGLHKAKSLAGKVTGASDLKEGIQAHKNMKSPAGRAAMEHMDLHTAKGTKEKFEKGHSDFVKKKLMTGGAKAVGSAAAVGAGAYAAGKKKESSAITELAIDLALAKVAEAEMDLDVAAERLGAVITLTGGDFEGTKVASAGTADQAIEIRSLELLEAAGYPVTWNV